jgi:hypothetical protein
MNKEMIVSSNGHETMVAILEDDLVAEIFVERERHRSVVGNVYKGRVSKVLPGMQSSFIDLVSSATASCTSRTSSTRSTSSTSSPATTMTRRAATARGAAVRKDGPSAIARTVQRRRSRNC